MTVLNNYNYFIVLAEELNISRAAERLFVSHQCLSKYLKNLEQEYNITFFERTPRLSLTSAGQVYLEMLRRIQLMEKNLDSQLNDIRESRRGVIRFGTTEGRFRVLLPSLLSEYKRMYPEVLLEPHYANSDQLLERLAKNELDLALMNKRNNVSSQLESRTLLKEKMYLVISDHVLAQYFPEQYPACAESFRAGVDLAAFAARGVPFILGHEGFNSRDILEKYLQTRNLKLNCVLEMTQQDMHFLLAAKDFAACFCWAMYVPTIRRANESRVKLHVFPIRGMKETNEVTLVMPRGRIFPSYGRDLVKLIQTTCTSFATVE